MRRFRIVGVADRPASFRSAASLADRAGNLERATAAFGAIATEAAFRPVRATSRALRCQSTPLIVLTVWDRLPSRKLRRLWT